MWREAKEESKSKRRKAFSVLKLSKQRRMELSENSTVNCQEKITKEFNHN